MFVSVRALDGTHIKACLPAKSVDRFRGRKSYPTQNVLAVVDFDLHFTYVLAGWEGSAHDLSRAARCPFSSKWTENS